MRTTSRPRLLTTAVAAAAALASVAATTVPVDLTARTAPGGAPAVGRSSLPTVESGPRPGPDVLYAPAPKAPQLETVGAWTADPILVSGTEAYREGEYLYQDYLHDDHGATGVPDPGSIWGPGEHLYSPAAGTFTYPADPVYAHNAADLVELRVKPRPQATAFRVTLNTLKDPDLTGFTIALGDGDGAAVAWPHGAGVSSPAAYFLTVHGDTAELLDAVTGEPTAAQPTATVDRRRRQVDVRVPHAAWDPGRERVRVTIGVGLWDPAAGTYLAPKPGSADATTPGGGTPDGVALVNVGPRFDEPWPDVMGATMADTAAGAAVLAPWWRERQQSLQLSRGDVSPFATEVDFGKLHDRVRDDSAIPTSGPMNRILASAYSFGQGIDPSEVCYDLGRYDAGAACVGRFVGQLQPYAIYVPEGPVPAGGYGLTLLLHSLSANYNQYADTRNQSQLGDRGAGSIVITPSGRGPDGFYSGFAETDTFETWADVARHYPLDPDWTVTSGYSMGGFGTYRLMARYPDLFARGFSVVGRPGSVLDQLPSMRHTPLLAWNAAGDELVHVNSAEEAHEALVAAGVPHTYDLFPTADHLTLAGNDEYGPGADYLGEHRIDRDPSRVTYVRDPREDNAAARVVADHAYWLSDITVRDPESAPTGTVDVRSYGRGELPGAPLGVAPGGGVLTGGFLPALAYVQRVLDLGEAETFAAADRLEITATNVGHVTVDPRRAGVSCDADVTGETDGRTVVELAGCGVVVVLDAG